MPAAKATMSSTVLSALVRATESRCARPASVSATTTRAHSFDAAPKFEPQNPSSVERFVLSVQISAPRTRPEMDPQARLRGSVLTARS